MKITCPSCQTENLLEASAGQLIDASCHKCGAILPAAGARESLDDLRDELEQEVGSIFAEDPSRQIQTTPLRIGAASNDAVRSISSPSVPAFKVVDTSASSPPEPATPAADGPDAEQTGEVAGAESDPQATEDAEVQWSPAAEDLSSLIEEQYSAPHQAEQGDRDDDMLKPPEIKPKSRAPAGPPPPLAFDEDFKGASDPHMQALQPPRRHGSMIGQAAVAMIEPPRRRALWIAAVTLAFIIVVGLLSVIVALLWRDQKSPIAPPVLAQASAPSRVDTPAPAVGADGSRARDAGAPAPSQDASTRAAPVTDAHSAAPDTRATPKREAHSQSSPPVQTQTASGPIKVSPKPRPSVVKTPSREPSGVRKNHGDTGERTARTSTRVRWKPKPKPQPKPRSRSRHPKGCDPVLFSDPLDCPRAGPPGKAEILEVVRENLRDIDDCAKKQFAADPARASGVVVMRFTIRPTGRTTRVAVVSPEFKNSVVGACLAQKIQGWSFGAFDGRAVGPIKFPFKLRTR